MLTISTLSQESFRQKRGLGREDDVSVRTQPGQHSMNLDLKTRIKLDSELAFDFKFVLLMKLTIHVSYPSVIITFSFLSNMLNFGQ